ncbi:hypothetical protein [Actinocorallia lasiicapitis]
MAAIALSYRPLLPAFPIVLLLLVLLLLGQGYLIGREHRHRRRRQASRELRVDRQPDPSTRAPQDFPGFLEPTAGLRRSLGDPVDHQGRLRAKGVRLAATPLLATTMLSIQMVFLPGGGAIAVGLAAAECAALLVMLETIWSDRRPAHTWVTSRMRTELFRREMYLVLAATGPYLGATQDEVERVRDARINLLIETEGAWLDQLASLTDRDRLSGERPWIDLVWQAGPRPTDSDTVERMRTYLEYRIRRQILFFRLGAEKAERTENVLGGTAKVSVLAGLTVALVYATALANGQQLGRQPGSMAVGILALSAAIIPALCNGVLALQSLFSAQRLAGSYLVAHTELVRHENTLVGLIADAAAPDTATRFRALALHVETTLTQELLRWRLLTTKPEFDPAM